MAPGLATRATTMRGKRNNGGVSDIDILNYALVLERLEYEFYRRLLQ